MVSVFILFFFMSNLKMKRIFGFGSIKIQVASDRDSSEMTRSIPLE